MDDKQQEISTSSVETRAMINEHLVKLQELRNELEGQQRKLINQENSLKQDIKRKNNEIQKLERKIEQIAKENEKTKERISASMRLPPVMQLKPWQEQCLARRDELKAIHPLYVKIVLCYIRSKLFHILECPEKVPEEKADTRETYKVYGLLLSACSFRKRDPELTIVNQVVKYIQDNYQRRETHIIEEYVIKAVMLTHHMLTLVPPLLITTKINKYNEAMHAENRATWDDALMKRKPLIYYRPILVLGNQLPVVEKGLVGNKIEEEPKKQQHLQKLPQLELQKSLPLELQKESKYKHPQMEKQYQQLQGPTECAASKKVLHSDEGGAFNYLPWYKSHYKCTLCNKEPLDDEIMIEKQQNDVSQCSSV